MAFWKANDLQGIFDAGIEGIAQQGCLGFYDTLGKSPDYFYPRLDTDRSLPARCCVLGCALLTPKVASQVGPAHELLEAALDGYLRADGKAYTREEVLPNNVTIDALDDLQLAHDCAYTPEDFILRMQAFASRRGLRDEKLALLDAAWVAQVKAALQPYYATDL